MYIYIYIYFFLFLFCLRFIECFLPLPIGYDLSFCHESQCWGTYHSGNFLWGQTREICQNIWGLSIVAECVLDLQRYMFLSLCQTGKNFSFFLFDCSTFHREALMLHETASKTKWNKWTKKKTRVWKHCVHLFPTAVLIGVPFLLARTTKSWCMNYLLGC